MFQMMSCTMLGRAAQWLSFFYFAALPCSAAEAPIDRGSLRAGAAIVDITPTQFPVIVNGMFEERQATSAHDPLHVRCLVLEQGSTRIAIAVADSCMLPRDLIDRAKEMAERATGIPADHMLVSATHTHSAPAGMGCLGSREDPQYVQLLPGRIAQAIELATKNLKPAEAGSAAIPAPDFTYSRRWIYRPEHLLRDPFGELTVRANMHPGYLNPDAIGPSGPADSGLSLLAVRSIDGRPIAVLANFAMHYFGSPLLSSDYYGLFCDRFAQLIGADKSQQPPFVAIMSQGTSGDLYWTDYSRRQRTVTIDQYTDGLATLAKRAYDSIKYRRQLPLAMKESKLAISRRIPDEKRLAASKTVLAKLNGAIPKTIPEIYAREQVLLAADPVRELKLQAIRVGDFGIAAIPCEIFGLTGLKIKSRSPLATSMVIELANGSEGYIPPPEQHKLGGYTTWPARTAALEVQAEPKIVEAILGLLEEASGKPRHADPDVRGAYAHAVMASKPIAWWPLGELNGSVAADASGNDHAGSFEDGVVFGLEGPLFKKTEGEAARAAQFAGGRMKTSVPKLDEKWSAELWFWNGLSGSARAVAGYLFSRGADGAVGAPGEHLGIGGTAVAQNKLLFFNGNTLNQVLAGSTEILPRTWNHVVCVRDRKNVTVYLNGNTTPEIEGEAEIGTPNGIDQLFVGGRSDNLFNLEGRICQAAVYDRALTANEVAAHYLASGLLARPNTINLVSKSAPPLSPEESLKVLHVRAGFQVDLVAAEPLIMDPVAIAWGADGKLWVVEMADYPSGIDGNMKSGGRVRNLESTHGDGHYDKSTLFMEGINFPTGIIPWRNGVIVTAAPEIFYAEAKTPGGKADFRQTLFRGFKEGNAQLRVNGLRWGIDGWLYCANGWSGGVVHSEKSGQTVNIEGHDFRIRPDDGRIELQSGMSEFGRDSDDWNDWFGCDNSNPLFHYPFDDRYLRRNPFVAPPLAKVQLELPVNPKVFARSTPQKRYHSFEHVDHFTSACSGMVYRDDLLFAGDADHRLLHAFTCEPVHNLVHHEILRPAGVTFTAARPDEEGESEFLASEDQWFRPVMVRTGPDGALWVVDMYRFVIEHPDWLPPEGKSDLAKYWRLGEYMGRIYRVRSTGSQLRKVRRLDSLGTADLVAALASPSAWERDTAQQLLVWRADSAVAAPELRRLLTQSDSPAGRMTALCTLDLLGAIKPEDLERGLQDAHPAVRRQAVRISEAVAKDAPRLIDAAAKLAQDPDAAVRLQLACTLGEWEDPGAGAALGALAMRDGEDPMMAGAIMSSALKHYPKIAAALVASGKPVSPKLMQDLFGTALGVGNRDVMAALLQPIVTPHEPGYTAGQLDGFRNWLDTLAQRGKSLATLRDGDHDPLAERLALAPAMFEAARQITTDTSRPPGERAMAVGLLGREAGREEADLPRLAALLTAQTPGDLQLAAVRALGATAAARTPALLMNDWATHAPELRRAAIDVMMGREPWALELLTAIGAGTVPPNDLDLSRRHRLLNSQWATVRDAAAKRLGTPPDPVRQSVVEACRPALSLTGDVKRGSKVFAQNCTTCHRLDGVGQEVGPNLLSVSGWTPDTLLVAILDPNRQVEPRYLAFTATLNDGEAIYGVITAESPASLSMKGLDGHERVLLRPSLKSLVGTNRSLMPDGLESALSKQDLADIIAFLHSAPGGK